MAAVISMREFYPTGWPTQKSFCLESGLPYNGGGSTSLQAAPEAWSRRSATEGCGMFTMLLAVGALGTAAGVGLAVGKRRPVLGVLAAAGVILAAVAGYCVLLALSLLM
jgi:hypothetical protein